jgi:arylsulfatase A-like enzyme/tetratricopeptide (TPR) repeat protein
MSMAWGKCKMSRIVILLVSLLGLSCIGPVPGRFNLLLVSFDTTRADHLGCYGYGQPTSPNIDLLADRSVRFEHAYTPTPITLPAHASLFTGAYPASHGVRSNGIFSLGGQLPTLAESFKDAGFATAAFVSSFVMDSRYGLGRGFTHYDDDLVAGGRRGGVLNQRERSAEATTDTALEWLTANGENNFFAFVHYFDPHRPFEAPGRFTSRFENLYDAEIAYADSQLGRLLAALDSLGLAGNTIIVVVADHGEGLGDHGEDTHALFVYNSTVRVPVLIHVPGRPELAGVVSTRQASLVDVAPTLASLCAVEVPSGAQGRPLLTVDGVNDAPGVPPLYIESYYPYYSHGWSPLEGFIDGGMKYIHAPQPELYELAADPRELNNLYGVDSERDKRYERVLANVRSGITPGDKSPAARALTAEESGRLRSLGYVAGRVSPPPADFSGLPDPKLMAPTLSAYMLGVSFMSDGRLDLAAGEFERVLQSDPTNFAVWEFLSETELLLGNPLAAERAARKAAEAPEPGERTWFCFGMSLLEQADTAGAVEMLERTLLINPLYGPALAIAARIEQARGRHISALDYYTRALEAMPANTELLTDFGSCLLALGRAGEAEDYLRQAVKNPIAGWRTWFDLGVACQLQGKIPDAVSAYQRAAKDSLASAIIFNNLGICQFSLGLYGQSEQAYRRALELEGANAETWNNLGGSLAAQGEITGAAQAYEHALQLQPRYPDACFNYALLLAERLSKPDSALVLIERGIELAPDSPRTPTMKAFAGGLRKR